MATKHITTEKKHLKTLIRTNYTMRSQKYQILPKMEKLS